MRMSLRVTSVAVVVLAASQAQAQYYGGPTYTKAATAGESYARGYADVVRSAGMYNLMSSKAVSELQDAQSKYLDNRLKSMKVYEEERKYREWRREQITKKRLSTSQLYDLARQASPDRLKPSQLDPLSGAVNWPLLLTSDEFEPYRKKIDAMMAERAKTGGYGSYDTYLELDKTARAMLGELKDNVKDYPPQDYVASKRFLENLIYEARHTAG